LLLHLLDDAIKSVSEKAGSYCAPTEPCHLEEIEALKKRMAALEQTLGIEQEKALDRVREANPQGNPVRGPFQDRPGCPRLPRCRRERSASDRRCGQDEAARARDRRVIFNYGGESSSRAHQTKSKT
jgi:hypothetical protein